MSKLFQIHETDLADLERLLPEVADETMAILTPRLRVKFRQAKAILSNVRWNYGPPTDVETVPDSSPDET